MVAFCTDITRVDPIKYGLIFERFLNPARIQMPDIDIDFDDRGRGKVIDYVVQKYGRESVCQIVTFGTMGSKSVIRDVARVLETGEFDAITGSWVVAPDERISPPIGMDKYVIFENEIMSPTRKPQRSAEFLAIHIRQAATTAARPNMFACPMQT